MSVSRGNSENAQEIWTKVNSKWQGDDANAFYREYASRIIESTQQFDKSCDNLKRYSTELSKELQVVYQSFQK